MKYIGNYKWLEDITKVYGPVSMHMCNVAFRYNNKIIKINVLLMGDLHTETPDIKDTKNPYKLLNFLLNTHFTLYFSSVKSRLTSLRGIFKQFATSLA